MAIDQSSQTTTQDSPEQRFLDYARSGDKATIQALIKEYADRSYNQARRIIGRDDGAEDAVQDAYLRLVSTASRYNGSVPFAAWLGCLVNTAALKFRQRRIGRHTNVSGLNDQGVAAMNDFGATSEAADEPEFEALRTAFDSLPDRYRKPMTMHFFGGLDHSETAQALGVPAGTIRKQLARGLERLRAKLGRAGFAVTSAGLLTVLADIPTYAASPAFKASLIASERLVAAASHAVAGNVSFLVKNAGLFKAAVIAATIASGAILVATHRDAAIPLPSPQVDLQKGMVGYWKLDEYVALDGSHMKDSTVNGNSGVFSSDDGAVNKSIAGRFGQAVTFDGENDHISLGQPASLLFTGAMTVSCWAKFNDLNGNYRLVSKQGDGDANRSWDLCVENFDPDIFAFHLSPDGVHAHDVVVRDETADGPVIGVWTHIAAVYVPSTAVRLYRNGVMIVEKTTGIPPAQHTANGSDIYIGADARMYWDQINGAIDEVRIYNRSLSSFEIYELANFAPPQ
jgi:RNA polymerase sigma-70 factor (ECF subfamily)